MEDERAAARKRRRQLRTAEDEAQEPGYAKYAEKVEAPKVIKDPIKLSQVSQVREILKATRSTGNMSAGHREWLVSLIVSQVSQEANRLGYTIKFPDYRAKSNKITAVEMDPLSGNVNEKISMQTAIRLLKIVGYDSQTITRLEGRFPSKTKRRSKSKTAFRSGVQAAKSVPARPKTPPPRPRAPPRSTSPKPVGPKMETESPHEIRTGRRTDRSPSPGRRKSKSPRRERKRKTKSASPRARDRRIPI